MHDNDDVATANGLAGFERSVRLSREIGGALAQRKSRLAAA